MPRRRTTLVLRDKTYAKLVQESLRRFGTPRAVSKVVDTMVEESTGRSEREGILKLLSSKKVAKVTSKEELERDRAELAHAFESR